MEKKNAHSIRIQLPPEVKEKLKKMAEKDSRKLKPFIELTLINITKKK